jgi:hypothetical protein
VEPDLFSFNEPDIGVRVFMTPQEHRDAIKRIGGAFEDWGLRTRCVLGGAASPRGTHTYAEPAVDDPEAMRHVGAVAFHSWGGASGYEYRAWSQLAREVDRPLLVTELGVDPYAWQTGAYDSFDYALREVAMYQEILLHARPQGLMHWQFTADYSLLRREDTAAGPHFTPTSRYWFVKHFCDLTPRNSTAVAVRSDRPDVLLTAFRGAREGKVSLALHIFNPGRVRKATIEGFPATVERLRAVRTDLRQSFRETPFVPVIGGSAKISLTAHSLTTLRGEWRR